MIDIFVPDHTDHDMQVTVLCKLQLRNNLFDAILIMSHIQYNHRSGMHHFPAAMQPR